MTAFESAVYSRLSFSLTTTWRRCGWSSRDRSALPRPLCPFRARGRVSGLSNLVTRDRRGALFRPDDVSARVSRPEVGVSRRVVAERPPVQRTLALSKPGLQF